MLNRTTNPTDFAHCNLFHELVLRDRACAQALTKLALDGGGELLDLAQFARGVLKDIMKLFHMESHGAHSQPHLQPQPQPQQQQQPQRLIRP